MLDNLAVDFSPLLPWAVLAPLFGVAVLVLALGLWRRAPGLVWRSLAAAALAIALLNPALVQEEREPIYDVAVIVVDSSPSQQIGERRSRTEAALAELEERLAQFDDLEVRVVRPENGVADLEQTKLFEALEAAITDVPRRRMAGTILLTDGQIHDVPRDPASLAGMGPVHTLLTGERDEADRRLVVTRAPSFGLVDRPITIRLRVDDLPDGGTGGPVSVTAYQDGNPVRVLALPTGVEREVEFVVEHGGQTVIEFEVEPAEEELSLANNRAAVAINGVRDRLRVLLVSGEPHPGERIWRNILKSDPSVDLVHFTILRPPEKQDGTPINELSLISFPIRELFELRLNEFDLIIFDRYRRRGVLPNLYLANIANYVQEGGAFLEASGPQFAQSFSLYRTPLGDVLPAEPTGEILEQGFRPVVTELGRRHPVTADLGGGAEWGRWFRQIDVLPRSGSIVMNGVDGRPLLVLDRVGEGRVAQLSSDQIWLWSRGYDGGGPHAELLRRLGHWLMKEPELEENDLKATVAGSRIQVERRRLEGEAAGAVEITTPGGETISVELTPTGPGRAAATHVVDQPGIFRITDGDRSTLAVVGTLNPPELTDMRTTEERLAGVAEATGGGFHWLADGAVPEIRRVRPDRVATGRDWLGLRANGDYVVTGVREAPMLPAALVLAIALGSLLAAWRREGR